MAKLGKLRTTKLRPEEQFTVVNDMKLQMTIASVADKYSAAIQAMIYKAYNDPQLITTYQAIRNSGIYERGGKTGARHRKILLIPNNHIFDFLNTVMTSLYGPDWLDDNRALRHELVRPWWVVSKL